MKRILKLCVLSLTTLLLFGCYKEVEQEIANLREDILLLEERVSKLNESLGSLSDLISAVEKNDHITDITEFMDGSQKAYRITFASGSRLTLTNGTNGVSPIVGVRFNEDYGTYYWTIQMGPNGTPTWMTNSYGLRVRATGSVPRLKIEDGVWWFSLDEGTTWNKCGWGPSQGESGSSVFSSIDTSDPYYVTFILSDWSWFQLPTQKAFDELNEQCNQVNESFETYKKLIGELNPDLFVKSVAQYENGEESGYTFTLESGRVLTIRNGLSSRDSVLLSAKTWTDGKSYWAFRNRSDEAYQWLRYQGSMICVSYSDVTPHIGITDSLGTLYFTVSHEGGPTEMMRDAKGNAVAATGKVVSDFFTDADISDPSEVVLTLANGTQVHLPRTREYVPSFTELSYGSNSVEPSKSYKYQLLVFTTDTLAGKSALPDFEAYQQASDTRFEAIAVDDGYVNEVVPVEFKATVLKNNAVAYDIVYDVRFTTGPGKNWDTTHKYRIAMFLNWHSHSVMKVAEFNRVIPATGLKLPKSVSVKKGESVTVEATITPSNTTDKIEWSTSDETIATISTKGSVKGIAAGTCIITAKIGKITATCKCTVTE